MFTQGFEKTAAGIAGMSVKNLATATGMGAAKPFGKIVRNFGSSGKKALTPLSKLRDGIA